MNDVKSNLAELLRNECADPQLIEGAPDWGDYHERFRPCGNCVNCEAAAEIERLRVWIDALWKAWEAEAETVLQDRGVGADGDNWRREQDEFRAAFDRGEPPPLEQILWWEYINR